MGNELRLTLLGGLQITQGGIPLAGLASHKGQALLCYLALTRRAHTRDVLANLLWSDAPQEEARTSLRAILAMLRRVVAPHLTITRDTLAFNPASPYWLDVEVFLARLGPANVAPAGSHRPAPRGQETEERLGDALALYRGEFLEGFYVLRAPVFEEWMLGERQWLHGMAVANLHRLAAACLHQGDVTAAVGHLNRLLVLEPWREEARRELMQLLAETGQRSAALAQYETCRRILLAELGVEPTEETTALYQRILQGEIAARPPAGVVVSRPAAPPVPHNLPAALTALIGRDVEIAQLTERLQRPALRLLTLVGPGGIGKTRLALDLAARLLPDFPDGVFLVALAALRQPELVPVVLAQTLRLPEEGGRAALDVLKTWLAGRRMLLVLDNFEQLLDATPLLIDLLQAAPALKILVTSREPLYFIGEHVFPVPPLPVPTAEHLPALASLEQYAAIALFCARAEAVQFDFALTTLNAAAIVEICRRLDGSPLAIELAAAQARGLAVAEIARRLDDRLRLLNEGNRGAPARQQTLRASIAWSYDLLAAPDQPLFRTLAVFAGGWTLPAAAAVCAGSELAEAAVAAGVRRLVDKSLVVAHPAGRYGMHESIRQYAEERLAEAGEAEIGRLRHLQYFTALAESAEPQLTGPDQLGWLDQLDAEHDNVRAALNGVLDQPAGRGAQILWALRLSGALWRFWIIRGYTREGRQRLEAVLAALPGSDQGPVAGDPPQPADQQALLVPWAKVLGGAGVLAYEHGDYAHSRSYLEQHLRVRRALADKKALAAALNNLAHPLEALGDLIQARLLLEESLALKRDLGDQMGIANSLSTLGTIAYDQGDYQAARTFIAEGVALARELGDRQGLVTKLNNLGNALLAAGDWAAAQTLYTESLALARELGDKPGIARALGNLGRVAADQGDYAGALALQKESLAQFRQAGYLREMSENVADIALIWGVLRRGAAAVRLLGAAEAVRRVTNYQLTPADQARSERDLGQMRAAIPIAAHDWAAAYNEGLALTLEQAIDQALA